MLTAGFSVCLYLQCSLGEHGWEQRQTTLHQSTVTYTINLKLGNYLAIFIANEPILAIFFYFSIFGFCSRFLFIDKA